MPAQLKRAAFLPLLRITARKIRKKRKRKICRQYVDRFGCLHWALGSAKGDIHKTTAMVDPVSEFGGAKPKAPLTGIQAQHPAPAPHARHDRSMARKILVAGAKPGGLYCSDPRIAKHVPSSSRVQSTFWLILARKNTGFLVDMNFLCSRHIIKIKVL